MYLYIMLGSGIAWTITYILIILRNFRDRTYGMPMAALFANISWEFIFSFVLPSSGIQRFVNITWFALDTIILVQYCHFDLRFNLCWHGYSIQPKETKDES